MHAVRSVQCSRYVVHLLEEPRDPFLGKAIYFFPMALLYSLFVFLSSGLTHPRRRQRYGAR